MFIQNFLSIVELLVFSYVANKTYGALLSIGFEFCIPIKGYIVSNH